MQIDAALVANSSWLKAILWAFVLALREQTIEGLNANPFPLVILDDPQMTFDPATSGNGRGIGATCESRYKRTAWNAVVPDDTRTPILPVPRKPRKARSQQGLIAAINKISGVATIVNGCSLERGWNDAKANNDDALARKYISDVRVYCEDLLKFMLRGEDSYCVFKSRWLKQELKRLQEGAVVPFNRRAFVDLRNTLDGGGGKSMKLINESHHRDDGTIGLAEAEDVKKSGMAYFRNRFRPRSTSLQSTKPIMVIHGPSRGRRTLSSFPRARMRRSRSSRFSGLVLRRLQRAMAELEMDCSRSRSGRRRSL